MKKKIAILSNININFLLKSFEKDFEVFKEEGFNQFLQLLSNQESNLTTFKPDFLFLIFDFYFMTGTSSNVEEYIHQVFSTIEIFLQNNNNISLFISNAQFPPNKIQFNDSFSNDSISYSSVWFNMLRNLLNKYHNLHFFDLSNLIIHSGIKNVYSLKYFLISSTPYKIEFFDILYYKIKILLNTIITPRKKVLCIDLDNTIWNGVLGDDGPFGIKFFESPEDKMFLDIQKKLLQIKNLGVLLCIVSKNSINNVREVFEKNTNLILKLTDFTIIKSNWNTKSQNLIEISQELNLGLDSFVFLDDNDFEKNEVKEQLPEVEVIFDFKIDNKILYLDIIDSMFDKYFLSLRLTKEDLMRNNQYEQIKSRNLFKNATSSFGDFIKSLDMKIEVSQMNESQKDRVFQLINKTNQFNLTTQRLSLDEFSSLNTVTNPIYVVKVRDKFADEGLVFVVITKIINSELHIDNIIMSCRVMGREVENSVLSLIEEKYFNQGINTFYGTYIPSKKNNPVQSLYTKWGFKLIDNKNNIYSYKKTISNENMIKPLVKAFWNSI